MKYFEKVFASLCFVIFIGLLFIGLWPLDFSPPNEVWWLNDGKGLHFHGNGIGARFSGGGNILTHDPLVSPHHDLSERGALSIEIWLRPAIEPNTGRSRILSFLDGTKTETLFIDQWKSYFLIFFRTLERYNKKQYSEIGISKALITGETRFVTTTSGENGTVIYLEGKPVKRFSKARLIPPDEFLAGQTLMIGNSPDALSSWSGDLLGLAVYDRILTEAEVFNHFQLWTESNSPSSLIQNNALALYTFDERFGTWAHSRSGSSNPLSIPARLQFEKRILVPPDVSRIAKTSFIKDGVINVCGFIPFGFFISFWLTTIGKWNKRYVYIFTIFLGFLVSLTIELLQIYLPMRNSSLTDLFCNTIGTFLGVLILHHTRQKVVVYLKFLLPNN